MNTNVMVGVSEDLLRSFQFRFRNWDSMSVNHPPFLTEPFCLSQQDHDFLVTAVETFHPHVTRIRERIACEPAWIRCLGLDDWTQEVIVQEVEMSRLKSGLEIARYDFFKTTDGRWMISEINNDVPSGFNESGFMHELALRSWQGSGQYDIPDSVTENFVRAIRAQNLRSLAMIYGTAYAEDLQVCLFLKDHLQSFLKVVLASPSHLRASRNKATVWNEPQDAIYRVYPVEWFSALPNRSDWKSALRLKNLQMINPLSTIISQSKNFFAVLHKESRHLFPADDATSSLNFIPYTEPFSLERIPAYMEEKDRWVLKPIFGRMGYDVCIGKLQTSEEWQKNLGLASKKPEQYAVQECFDIAPVQFSLANCYPCVGVFVINGRFSGYFTRASLTPLTTYEAMDVATIIKLS